MADNDKDFHPLLIDESGDGGGDGGVGHGGEEVRSRFGWDRRKRSGGRLSSLPRRRLVCLLISLVVLFIGAPLSYLLSDTSRVEEWRQRLQTDRLQMPLAAIDDSPLPYHATADTSCDERYAQEWGDTMFILKTGATVAHQRASGHLQSALRCMPHQLYISDVDMNVNGVQFLDVIKYLDKSVLDHPMLDFYHELVRQAGEKDRTKFEVPAGKPADSGKGLDRFKFIPMVWLAWKKRTKAIKWYFFIEADTLVDYGNLRVLLNRLDADKPLYAGFPQWTALYWYAHGGSGIIFSHTAMERSVGAGPQRWLDKWGDLALRDEFGDRLLGGALTAYDVGLVSAAPLIQWNKPERADILPLMWCAPVVSMHHVDPAQIAEYWRLVATEADDPHRQLLRNNNTSLLYRDVFYAFVMPKLSETKADWNNDSGDYECSNTVKFKCPSANGQAAIGSPSGCAAKCATIADCRQWSHHDGICRMHRAVNVGNPVRPEDRDEGWVSGWMLDRIKAYKDDHPCKNGADWTI